MGWRRYTGLPLAALGAMVDATLTMVVLKHGQRTLLRILSLAFAGSFVVAYGWKLLLTPRGVLAGVGNLLYLIAALFALGAWLSAFGARLGNEPTPSEAERRGEEQLESTLVLEDGAHGLEDELHVQAQ